MKRAIVAVLLAVGMLGSTASAVGELHHARYEKVKGGPHAPKAVVLLCAGWTEDSVASWHMAQRPDAWGDGKLILRCDIP